MANSEPVDIEVPRHRINWRPGSQATQTARFPEALYGWDGQLQWGAAAIITTADRRSRAYAEMK